MVQVVVGSPATEPAADIVARYSLAEHSLPDAAVRQRREIVAHGVRNSVGFDWQPGTNALYATDNGRDLLGDDVPNDELNEAASPYGRRVGERPVGKSAPCLFDHR